MTEYYRECVACNESVAALDMLMQKMNRERVVLMERVPEAPEGQRQRPVNVGRLFIACESCDNQRVLLTASGELLLGVLAAAAQRKKLDPIPF